MFFRPSSQGRRNARRAVFGSVLILGGFVTASLIGTGKLHRALTADLDPVSTSCRQLVSREQLDSPIFSLTDAAVHPPAAVTTDGLPEDAPEIVSWVYSWMADPRLQPVVDQCVRGQVTPQGLLPTSNAPRLNLGYGRWISDEARTQVKTTGGLVVHVTEDPTAKFLSRALEVFGLDVPDSLRQQANNRAWTLHPVTTIDSVPKASAWGVGGILAMSLGWLLCGSAGLGRWTILCPLGAVLGLPGLPFRSGRGNRMSRTCLVLLGFGLIGLGYQLTVPWGGLLRPTMVWPLLVAATVSISLGIAAVVGGILSARSQRPMELPADWADGLGSRPKKNANRKSKLDDSAASNVIELPPPLKTATTFVRRYVDPRLSVSAASVPEEEARVQTELLEKLDFEPPLLIEVGRGSGACDVTIQVGCHQMTLAMTDRLDGCLRLRMVSFLECGHVILTANDPDGEFLASCADEAATLTLVETNLATDLLTEHLTVAAEIGEAKGSPMVAFESSEWRDIIHYSERCLADILHHDGRQKWEIMDATYDRFTYPPQTIPALASC